LLPPQRDVAGAPGLATETSRLPSAPFACSVASCSLHTSTSYHLPHPGAYIYPYRGCLSPPDSARETQTSAPRHTWLVHTIERGTPFPPVALRQAAPATHHTHDMVNERPKQFGGMPRFGGAPRPGFARPTPSSQTTPPSASRATQLGLGLGKGAAGLGGLGKGKGVKRHM
jgi:hypothetical protein